MAGSTTIVWGSEKHQRDATIKGLATHAAVEQNLFHALEESAKMQRKLDSITLNDAQQQKLQIDHIQQVRSEVRERQSALLAANEEIHFIGNYSKAVEEAGRAAIIASMHIYYGSETLLWTHPTM